MRLRADWVLGGLLLVALGAGVACGTVDSFEADDAMALGEAKADGVASTSTFYRFRQDTRRCLSPLCGGLWVSRVNFTRTKCVDGAWQAECYVADASWAAVGSPPERATLLRGSIRARSWEGFGTMGQFLVTEAWAPVSERAADGLFYRLSDNGLRCVSAPCNSTHQAKLNSTTSADLGGVDFSGTGASDAALVAAQRAMASGGVLVAGANRTRAGSTTLVATQLYARVYGEFERPAACTRSSDCVASGYSRAVASEGDCYCARCPTTPMNKSAAAAYQASHAAACSERPPMCPAVTCVRPRPVACVAGACVFPPFS